MRQRRARGVRIPPRYRRYRPEEWPDGPGAWASEREAWNAAQPDVLHAGEGTAGAWVYMAGPLGDSTDLLRARREARMIAQEGTG